MKFKYTIIIAMVLIACTSSSSNLATDKQKNWCYGAATSFRQQDNIVIRNFMDAEHLYNVENDANISYGFSEFANYLSEGDETALGVCKIWADMNNE